MSYSCIPLPLIVISQDLSLEFWRTYRVRKVYGSKSSGQRCWLHLFLQALLGCQYNYQQGRLGCKLRAGLTCTIFNKSLMLNSATLAAFSSGEVQTFMSVDADRWEFWWHKHTDLNSSFPQRSTLIWPAMNPSYALFHHCVNLKYSSFYMSNLHQFGCETGGHLPSERCIPLFFNLERRYWSWFS